MPMTVMTDPVTTGGKKCSRRVKTPDSRNPTSPATRMAPKMPGGRARRRRRRPDGDHRGDRGERGALHDRQFRADPLDAEGLQQGGQAGYQQGGGQQVGQVGEGQA